MPGSFYRFFDRSLEPVAIEAAARGIVMMPARKLKAFVDKLEDVDPKWQELYVEETVGEGSAAKTRFRLDADGVEDVSGLKNSLAAARAERDRYKKRAEPLNELGEEDDIEEIVTAGRAALEAKRTGKPIPEVEQAVTAEQRKSARKIKELETEQAALRDALNQSLDDAARAAIKDADGNARLLLPHIKSMIGLERVVDGDKIRYERRVYEGEGSTRTVRVDASGKPIGIDVAVAELRDVDDFADAFTSRVVPGSGTEAETRERGTPTPPRRTGTRETAGTVDQTRKDAKRQTQDYTL